MPCEHSEPHSPTHGLVALLAFGVHPPVIFLSMQIHKYALRNLWCVCVFT